MATILRKGTSVGGASGNPNGSYQINSSTAHTSVISIGVMLLVIVILIELAGTSHQAALGIGALLLSAVIIAGFSLSPTQLSTVEEYPQAP